MVPQQGTVPRRNRSYWDGAKFERTRVGLLVTICFCHFRRRNHQTPQLLLPLPCFSSKMSTDSLSDLSTHTSREAGETRLDLDVDEILPTFEAQLHRATLAVPGSTSEILETLTSKICLVAFYKCADFPSENMMAEMGVTRALLYYANITIQPDFIPYQPHDERWRTISKIVGHVVHKKRRSSPYIIPDVGTFSHHHPRHTLEYLFRDHAQKRPECGSDESKLLDLFGSPGKKLRAPVTYPCPFEVSDDLGQAGLGSKRGRGRPRGSANKPVLSSQDAHEQKYRSAPASAFNSKGPATPAADQSSRKRDFDNLGLHEPSTDESQWGSGRPKRQKVPPKVVLPSALVSSSSPKKAPSGKRKVAKTQKSTPSAHEPERVQSKVSAVKFIKMEPKEATKATNGVLKRRGRPPKARSGGSSLSQTLGNTRSTQHAERVAVMDSSQDSTTSPSGPNSTVSSQDYTPESGILFAEQPHAYYSPTSSSDSPVSELPLAIRRKYAVAAKGVVPEVGEGMSISDPPSSRESHE